MVLGDHRVHRDRHVGNGTGQKFFTDPLATANWVGLEVQRMSDQPSRVREHPLPVRHFGWVGWSDSPSS